MNKAIKAVGGIVLGLFVICWLWFVWPTPWKDYKVLNTQMRVNRFTGKTQWLSDNGWLEYK